MWRHTLFEVDVPFSVTSDNHHDNASIHIIHIHHIQWAMSFSKKYDGTSIIIMQPRDYSNLSSYMTRATWSKSVYLEHRLYWTGANNSCQATHCIIAEEHARGTMGMVLMEKRRGDDPRVYTWWAADHPLRVSCNDYRCWCDTFDLAHNTARWGRRHRAFDICKLMLCCKE